MNLCMKQKGFPSGLVVKNLLAKQEIWVQCLSWEDLLEKEMATHSSTLAWEIPWTEESGGIQSMGSQRVSHNLVTKPLHHINHQDGPLRTRSKANITSAQLGCSAVLLLDP